MFDIKLDDEGTIHLTGRLDASQVEKAETVFESVTESATADFSNLDYISSAGIAVFLAAYKRLDGAGKSLKLVNMKQRIRNVFHFAGLDTIFVIE